MQYLKPKYFIIAFLAIAAGGLLYLFKSQNPELSLIPIEVTGTPVAPENSTSSEEIDKGQTEEEKPGIVESTTVTAKSILDCLSKGGKSGECLDMMFAGYLKNHSTLQALALVEKIGTENSDIRLSCHPITHAIGRNTYINHKTVQDSFPECNQTCHSGCYHGVMERFLRGNLASQITDHVSFDEVKTKAKTACDPNQAVRFRFQCLHGLGHALMYFLDYNLEDSLASCDSLADGWSRSSCYGGVFMENVFSATPEKRDLSKTDYHYPCSKLNEKYKADCYMMQTTRMSEMGLNTDRLFEECKKAGNYRNTCMQSIGRDLSNDARLYDPRRVSEKCEKVSDLDREACTRGVAYALLDNTWDGKYGFPFCESYAAQADKSFCYSISKGYLASTFETSSSQIASQCKQFVPNSQTCIKN